MTPREIRLPDFPYESHFHAVDGGEMAYVDVGTAESSGQPSGQPSSDDASSDGASHEAASPDDATPRVILCVHGNPTWSYYYRRVIERFSSSHRVIAVDHLGCGRSDRPTRRQFGYAMADHVANLRSLVESLDLRRVTLVAHDWGGAIGTAAVTQMPDRFEQLALCNTAAFPPPYLPRRIAVCRWPILGPLIVRGGNGFARAAVTMAMDRQALSPAARRGLLATYDNWTNRVAIDAFVRDIPMHPSHPTHATLSNLESSLADLSGKQISLIWGMRDWCFRPECLDRLASVWPSADVTKIEDAGHYVLEDAPEEVLEALQRLIDR